MTQQTAVVVLSIVAPVLALIALYTSMTARRERIRADAATSSRSSLETEIAARDAELSSLRERHASEIRQIESRARQSTQDTIGSEAREATQAAVRSFGTSVVSLGADLSQVVSAALRRHHDGDVYETLTRIDHTVQQMMRQAQSYVIVCGGLPGRRWPAKTFTDIVGGATGRVRDYLRVQTKQLDRAVISRAVEPLVHTVATLLDNALRYSPPTSYVEVGFQEGHHGVTIVIDDAGVRMNAEQLGHARRILSGQEAVDVHSLGPSPKVGFPGIAALSRRYGFSVVVDGPNAYGGMRALVYVPEALLAGGAAEAAAPAVPAQPQAPVLESAAPSPFPEEPAGYGDPNEPAETAGGLPKRRRRTAIDPPLDGRSRRPSPEPLRNDGVPSAEPARPGVIAAWHNGTKSGRAAASDQNERTAP